MGKKKAQKDIVIFTKRDLDGYTDVSIYYAAVPSVNWKTIQLTLHLDVSFFKYWKADHRINKEGKATP